MLTQKIKLKSEIYNDKLLITCKPISTNMENPDEADIIHVSSALLNIKDVLKIIPDSVLGTKLLTSNLNEILNKLIEDKLYEIRDGFLSFEDPLFEVIANRLASENKEDVYLAYFTKESLESLNLNIRNYIKDVLNNVETSNKIYNIEIPENSNNY